MDLSYFETVNDEDEVSYIRPETKSTADLERVVSLAKPLSVVDKFIALYVLGLQWDWFELYQSYLTELDEVNAHNENPPLLSTDEEGVETYAEQKELPIEPIRPDILTIDSFKELNPDLFNSFMKEQGAEINGVIVSLNENNQNGIAAVLAGLNLASEIGIEMFPIIFKAESPSGISSISFDDLSEFKAFALTFMSERQVFFK